MPIFVGFLGGRWSGLDQKRTFLGGAMVGAIACIIAYGLIIAPATGIIGNKEILRYGLVKVGDETSLTWLILYGVTGTLWWGAIGFWICLAIGLFLGGLGGLMAIPIPDEQQYWSNLFPYVDPIMIFVSGVANLITYALINPLLDIVTAAEDKAHFNAQYPVSISINLILLAGLAWFLLWQVKLWVDLRKYQTIFLQQRLSWALAAFSALIMPTLFFVNGISLFSSDKFFFLASLISFIVAALTFRDTFWKRRALPMPPIRNPLANLRFIASFSFILSAFMTMTIMTGTLTVALNLATITISAIGPLTNGFNTASFTLFQMIDLTYSISRSVFETAFVVNGIYLFMALWTLQNTFNFLREFGPSIFRREVQTSTELSENAD